MDTLDILNSLRNNAPMTAIRGRGGARGRNRPTGPAARETDMMKRMENYNRLVAEHGEGYEDPYVDDNYVGYVGEEPTLAYQSAIEEGLRKVVVKRKTTQGSAIVQEQIPLRDVRMMPQPAYDTFTMRSDMANLSLSEAVPVTHEQMVQKQLHEMRSGGNGNSSLNHDSVRAVDTKIVESIIGKSMCAGNISPSVALALLQRVPIVLWLWRAFEPMLNVPIERRRLMSLRDHALYFASLGLIEHNFRVQQSGDNQQTNATSVGCFFYFEFKLNKMSPKKMSEVLAQREELLQINLKEIKAIATDLLRMDALLFCEHEVDVSGDCKSDSDIIASFACRLHSFKFYWLTAPDVV